MKVGVLFSGGKDSTFAAYLAKKEGHELTCLISIFSENDYSYMFHTPSISKVEKQAEVMKIPLVKFETKGEKELELQDLKSAILEAKEKFKIQGIVTGAVASVYQTSRVQKICDEFGLTPINPLWQINQTELLEQLIKDNFEIIITGIAAYPLDKTWIGRKIDQKFIRETKELQKKFGISPAGEGGEFETFVLNCPLFKEKLKVKCQKITGENHSFRMELELK